MHKSINHIFNLTTEPTRTKILPHEIGGSLFHDSNIQ